MPHVTGAGYASPVNPRFALALASLVLVACAHPAEPSAPATSGGTTTGASAGGKPGSALPEGPPLATPGEHMQYALSLKGVSLATYDLAIGDIAEVAGVQTITVQGHAKVSGIAVFLANIDDTFTSWVNVATGRPVRFQTEEYASGSKTDIEYSVVEVAARANNQVPVTSHVNEQQVKAEMQTASLPVTWDYNAFLLALRAWEGPPGSRQSLEVFRSRYMWHVDVKIHGKEKVVTALGELPALRIDGTTYKLDRKGQRDPNSEERVFTIWISNDDGRVPLQIVATTDYGDLKMTIVDYQPGSGQRLRK